MSNTIIVTNSYNLMESIKLLTKATFDKKEKGWVMTQEEWNELSVKAGNQSWGMKQYKAFCDCKAFIFNNNIIGDKVK